MLGAGRAFNLQGGDYSISGFEGVAVKVPLLVLKSCFLAAEILQLRTSGMGLT